MSFDTQDTRTAVGVVGAARVGLSLAHQIASNGYDVVLLTTLESRKRTLQETGRLVGVLPELERLDSRVQVTTDARELAARSTLIFVTITDTLLEQVLEGLGEHVDGAHMIVHATHSLYGEALLRSSQLIETITCVKQIGALAGPMHMSELLAAKPNVALVSSEFPEVIERARAALGSDCFHIYASNDVRGVEYAAALHQVVALAIGMCDGLQLGSATHAALAAAGLHEMSRIGRAQGAQWGSFYGLVGLGRTVDALQRGSANYGLGWEFARSETPDAVLEGAPAEAKGPEVVAQVTTLAQETGLSIPFTTAIARILNGEGEMEALLRGLMLREELFTQMGSVVL